MKSRFVVATVKGLQYKRYGSGERVMVEDARVYIVAGSMKVDGTFSGRPDEHASTRSMRADKFVFNSVGDVRAAGWAGGVSSMVVVESPRPHRTAPPLRLVVTRPAQEADV